MGRKHTTRHKARRKLEGCAHNCDVINTSLAELAAWYEDSGTSAPETLLEIGKIIEAARSLLLALRQEI